MSDRRRAAATATAGYGLVAGGGALRGHAIDAAHTAIGADGPGERMIPSSLAVYAARRHRVPTAGRLVRRWSAGTALVTLGAPAAAKGTVDLLHRRRTAVAKTQQRRRSVVHDAVGGTADAWRDKSRGLVSGAPVRVRAVPVAAAAGGAGAGSLLAHRLVDLAARRAPVPGPLRAAVTASAAVPGALATLPASRRYTRRHGYDPQPTGGLRRLSKADYLGARVTPRQQRLRVYAAGGAPIPLVGPVAAARQAGRYAPPGQRLEHQARTAVGGPVAGTAAGVGAAYGAAHVADRSQAVQRATQGVHDAAQRVASHLPHSSRPNPVKMKLAPAVASLKRSAALRPLVSSPRRAVAAAVGYHSTKFVVGNIGGQLAESRNLAAQREYNARHRIHAAGAVAKADTTLMSDRQRHLLVRRKRRAAVLAVGGGTAGLASLGLHLAARTPKVAAAIPNLARHRETALVASGGIGGVAAYNGALISHREAKSERQALAKRVSDRPATAWVNSTQALADRLERGQRGRKLRRPAAGVLRQLSYDATPAAHLARLAGVHKSAPLATSLTPDEAHHLVHGKGGYGLTGTLPHNLGRDERMRAYEARYVASGGHKARHWQNVAQGAEVARNAGLAGATAAGASWLAAGSPRLRPLGRLAVRHAPKLARVTTPAIKHRAERAAVAAGTLGGGAELTEEWAKHRRASYASAPGAVAASALRRMQNYPAGGGTP